MSAFTFPPPPPSPAAESLRAEVRDFLLRNLELMRYRTLTDLDDGELQRLARTAGVPTPNLDAVVALLLQRASDAGLYKH